MSAYSVGRTKDGNVSWWENWTAARNPIGAYEHVRPATDEEAEIMTKVVWDNDTEADRAKLRLLLGRVRK